MSPIWEVQRFGVRGLASPRNHDCHGGPTLGLTWVKVFMLKNVFMVGKEAFGENPGGD
jgi:hypothetical protein